MHWIFSPILPLCLFVLLFVLLLALFLAVKREQVQIRAVLDDLDRKWSELHEIQQTAFERLAGELQEMQERQPSVPRVAAGISMNLTRRQQVIQLARRGATPAAIASSLQIPAREVELLLKILKGVQPPG